MPFAALAAARSRAGDSAAAAPLLDPGSAQAQAVKYVEDATRASAAAAGSRCATCALYQGPDGSTQGPCQLFPGKAVKAAGWCSSWAPQM
ncbi:MAG TPA: high-potential iron-sulfur protein [Steroidobacteraceae bacterium]|nr:high-potential iron-sulfur protein [Steroidobacteraceae bacterium]